MHILMSAALLVLGLIFGPVIPVKAANDGTWCHRDFGATRSTNCSFYSARQCLIVAGTFGGICERNNPSPPPSKKEKSRPS
jgi:hypothetical protein